MRKRGPKPHRKEPIEWSADTAYGLGLLATDGCLSSDGRHIDLTSKDIEQLENFKKCFDLKTPISYKTSGYTGKNTPRVQFSDAVLYKFLTEIGFTPAKTKTIGALEIPDHFFFDFLRGHHDGDGYFYSYWDKRWKASYMFYVVFTSASKKHIEWIRKKLQNRLYIKGHITKANTSSVFNLKYAKTESLKILRKMYYVNNVTCLRRKRLKIEKALGIVEERL